MWVNKAFQNRLKLLPAKEELVCYTLQQETMLARGYIHSLTDSRENQGYEMWPGVQGEQHLKLLPRLKLQISLLLQYNTSMVTQMAFMDL